MILEGTKNTLQQITEHRGINKKIVEYLKILKRKKEEEKFKDSKNFFSEVQSYFAEKKNDKNSLSLKDKMEYIERMYGTVIIFFF